VCVGYLTGIVNAMIVYDQLSNRPDCIPAGKKMRDLLPLIQRYIAEHPDQHGFGTTVNAILAIRDAYECGWIIKDDKHNAKD
jgi:hypothetical protein